MLDFIVNPKAGTIKGKKLKKTLKKLEKHLCEKNIAYTIHKTNHKGHATTLTKNLIEHGATDIIAIGGDGTLHEIINGFHSFDKANLGLIPCGTGNDFARSCKLPRNPVDALDVILNSEPKFTDYMQLPTVRGMNVVGTGLDVDVLIRYEKLKRKTKFGYYWCLLRTLFGFKGVSFDAEVDGEKSSHDSFIAGVANGKCFGGGIQICPDADIEDGKLNFVSVKFVKGLKIVGLLLKLNGGKILQDSRTTTSICDEVKVSNMEKITVNVDGELYPDIPFEVKVVHNQLKMYRP